MGTQSNPQQDPPTILQPVDPPGREARGARLTPRPPIGIVPSGLPRREHVTRGAGLGLAARPGTQVHSETCCPRCHHCTGGLKAWQLAHSTWLGARRVGAAYSTGRSQKTRWARCPTGHQQAVQLKPRPQFPLLQPEGWGEAGFKSSCHLHLGSLQLREGAQPCLPPESGHLEASCR